MFSFQRFPRPVVFRRAKLLWLPREREVKEVDEEVHENDEEISHHRTGQSVTILYTLQEHRTILANVILLNVSDFAFFDIF